ncbi:hypothetical protein, conserved in T. vivax [Trypanosoma vivax Y486]|uniref:Uncharacterized protein n=1 Tax=Trypanosoma vivax (strain Y486) TaxID=1055687 RepID=F9WLH2_TRYVY|nr:hypothetical protein, conserved in T. vivax [Trypanosoma vivax Y486]|eukprot:CCD18363.1 hypothetical protein, conserved in T. vivax [Trypanosoma vivax Y486]
MNKPKWKNGGLDEQLNTIRHYETSGVCTSVSGGRAGRKGVGVGTAGLIGGAPHAHQACATCMCVGASTAVERDPCNAPRVAPGASHNDRTATATRCATQRAHAGLTRAASHSHAQGDGSKQLKGTATTNSQGAQARTATLIRLPLVEVALALVQRGALAMAHAHRSAAAEHGERCSHHLLLAAAAPHPRNRRQATKGENKLSSRHGTHSRHNAHNAVISADTSCTRVRLPCKRTHAVTAAAPQATEQAFNNTATIVASSTVASSAVALRSATAKCPAARHAAQRPDRPCGKTSSFSAVTQHGKEACLVRNLSHLCYLPPPSHYTRKQRVLCAMATLGRGPTAFASSLRFPADASRVRAARPPNTNRHAAGNGSGNSEAFATTLQEFQTARGSQQQQASGAQSCILRGAAVAHASLHGVSVSCAHTAGRMAQVMRLPACFELATSPSTDTETSSVATGKRAANRYNGSTPARSH